MLDAVNAGGAILVALGTLPLAAVVARLALQGILAALIAFQQSPTA